MATMRPNAVVIRASAIPADTAPSDPPPPDAAMPVNAFTIPITVPSRPTNGAVDPVVARMPRPRFSSADTIRISRSTARLTDHARHVALLLLLGELDRTVELLLLQEAGELGREPPRLPLRPEDLVQLLEGARPREDGHRRQDQDDGLREQAHRDEQVVKREAHGANAPLGSLLFEPEVDRNLNQHPYRPAVHPRGSEQRFQNVAFGRLIEAGVGAL